jgi:hypothetical protein
MTLHVLKQLQNALPPLHDHCCSQWSSPAHLNLQASSVFPAPLVPGAAPAILPAVNASAVVTGCELLSALSHHMARRNPAKRRNAAHLDALIAALSTYANQVHLLMLLHRRYQLLPP